ncbi:DEAD/DEAH box helicase [Phenylobacterium sp. SCN 70-31]|uniref:DEAD/DEAH box helicase n=1 Tax=Phenylobacterium sp. SCN 70-31 TaxID=1660129 RepID=UPI000869F632|nr:MAG: helicase [Phenylobacterium sp. SCN 70-31]
MPFPATHPALARALEAQGYREPTPVQAAVLEAPADRDLLVSAQTGSGKTVAFGLAAATALLGEAAGFDAAGAPLGLVIAPTRELALQVARELGWLYAPAGVRIATCVGGMDPRAEQRALAAGAHVVVGTPGRLRDHLERGNLDTSALRVAVLDEADEMLDMGFREDLEAILDSAPAERRTFLFSATIAREIAALARRYQRDAHRIDTVRRDEPHGDIAYRAVRVAPTDVENAVVNILRFYESPGALIFCATRERVRHLYGSLRERGFAVVQLSGELSQKERSDALQALRDGHARACIATDVAARGLDLPELGLVIHADLPAGPPALLHRSGRTGRAGRKGVSVIIAPHPKRRQAERLLQVAGVEAEWSGPPLPEEIRARDEARLFDDPALAEPPTPQDLELARRLLERRDAEAVAAALVRLHRSRLPEPEDILPDRGPDRGDKPRPLRPERQAQIDSADGSWFRLPIGRSKNADPKWLVPLICRLGHVTKKDIGLIRIFDHETKFQIASDVEGRFQDSVRAAADAGELRINPSSPPGAAPERSHAERGRPGRPPHRPRAPDVKGPPPRRKPRKT